MRCEYIYIYILYTCALPAAHCTISWPNCQMTCKIIANNDFLLQDINDKISLAFHHSALAKGEIITPVRNSITKLHPVKPSLNGSALSHTCGSAESISDKKVGRNTYIGIHFQILTEPVFRRKRFWHIEGHVHIISRNLVPRTSLFNKSKGITLSRIYVCIIVMETNVLQC